MYVIREGLWNFEAESWKIQRGKIGEDINEHVNHSIAPVVFVVGS